MTALLTRLFPLAALCCLLAAGARAQSFGDAPERGTITKVGTTAAQFLKIGVGARAVSMGGSFAAEANDLSALYWNPGGLARMPGSQVQLAFTDYAVDISYSYAAVGLDLGTVGTVALSLLSLNSGDMMVRTVEQPDGTGEEFSVQNLALQLSYGRALTDRFAIGATAKYVREQIWHSSANAFAFDVGLLYTTPFDRLRLGAAISNFGPKMRMNGRDIIFSTDPAPGQSGNVEIVNAEYRMDEYPLPLMFRLGLALDVMRAGDHRFVLLSDAAHPSDNHEYVNVGAEYRFRDLIALRTGYRNLFDDESEQSYTLGGGLGVRLSRSMRVQFDYAYAPLGRLGNTHWYTLNLGF